MLLLLLLFLIPLSKLQNQVLWIRGRGFLLLFHILRFGFDPFNLLRQFLSLGKCSFFLLLLLRRSDYLDFKIFLEQLVHDRVNIGILLTLVVVFRLRHHEELLIDINETLFTLLMSLLRGLS